MIKKCGFIIVSITLLLSLVACSKTVSEKENQTSVSTSIEVANFNLSDLIELRKVISEALSYAKTMADENQKSLANQADILMVTIQPDSKLKDVVANKTEQERVTLEILKGIFSVGAQYFYKIPSLIAGAIANSADELGNKIAEWQVLGQLSYAKVTSDTAVMEVVYHKSLGEIWASFDINNPLGRLVMYIPVEPILVSPEGSGNILLSKGVRPILENIRVAYHLSNNFDTSTPTSTTMTPSITSSVPTKSPKGDFLNLTALEIGDRLLDERLSKQQREDIWDTEYKNKWVRWYGEVVEASINQVAFGPSGSDILEMRVYTRFNDPIPPNIVVGDVYAFDGVLDKYGLDSFGRIGFTLRECTSFTLILKKIWDRETPRTHDGYVNWATLIGVDNDYVYTVDPIGGLKEYVRNVSAYILDKKNGYFISEDVVSPNSFKTWATSKSHGGFVESKLPLTASIAIHELDVQLNIEVTDEGIQFYDMQGKLLCEKIGWEGGSWKIDGAAIHGSLFISTVERLLAFSFTN